MRKNKNSTEDLKKFRREIGIYRVNKLAQTNTLNLSHLVDKIMSEIITTENKVLEQELFYKQELYHKIGQALLEIFHHQNIGKNAALLLFYFNILVPIFFQSVNAIELNHNAYGLTDVHNDIVNHQNNFAQLLYPCQSLGDAWAVPSFTQVEQSRSEIAKCKLTAENQWADVLEIILLRTIQAGNSLRANLNSSVLSYSELSDDLKKKWHDQVFNKLLEGSASASGFAEKENRQDLHRTINAKKGYQSAFNQLMNWTQNKAEITLNRIKLLHKLLMHDNSVHEFRSKNGGHPLANFADYKLVKPVLENMVSWLAHPNHDLHPFEIALITQQIFISIHPFNDANGRVSMLLLNWILMKHNYPPIALSYDEQKNFVMWSKLSIYGMSETNAVLSGKYYEQGVHGLTITPGIFYQTSGKYKKTWFSTSEREQYYKEQINHAKRLITLIDDRIKEAIEILKNQMGSGQLTP